MSDPASDKEGATDPKRYRRHSEEFRARHRE